MDGGVVEDGERFCEQWTCVESKKLSPSQDHTNERFVLGVMILLPIQYTIAFYPISKATLRPFIAA